MLISAIDNNKDYITTLKRIGMFDVIRWMVEAWKEIPNMQTVRFRIFFWVIKVTILDN